MAHHRAGKRNAPGTDVAKDAEPLARRSTSSGSRRAAAPSRPARVRSTHASARKSLFPALPSVPSLVGAAALVIAAGGAVTIGQNAVPDESGDIQRLSSQANVLTGSSQVESASRQQAVSRDSQREALQDAADEELQAAAETQAQERNAALAQLAASAERHADQIALNAWQLPVSAGVYHLTSRFGESSSLWANTHTGLDFAAPSGTPVMSVANGVVSSAGYDGSYGNKTVVTLEDGTEVWYCHQTSFGVTPGDSVRAGQTIGTVGTTGNSTGPHLHLEVRPGAGDPVDPYSALLVHGLQP